MLVARPNASQLARSSANSTELLTMSAPVEWNSKLVIGQRARPRPVVTASGSSLNGVLYMLLSFLRLGNADMF